MIKERKWVERMIFKKMSSMRGGERQTTRRWGERKRRLDGLAWVQPSKHGAVQPVVHEAESVARPQRALQPHHQRQSVMHEVPKVSREPVGHLLGEQ